MNRDYALWHLREAAEALADEIRRLEAGDVENFETGVGVAHIYHHLNTAWNARTASEDASRVCSTEDFYRWRRFPEDLPDDFGQSA